MKRIGLLGAGTVGAALAQLINVRKDIDVTLSKALVRDISKTREGLSAASLTTDLSEVLANADILVEVMGGTTLAGDAMLEHLKQNKPVVTANKAVLAERWDEFLPFVNQGLLHFEASIMAGTPVVGPLTNALRGSLPLELHAILNGTCNYILSELEAGVAYKDALAEAQRLGYAEADPTLDVGGFDAAHKLTVLARLVFDPKITWENVKANTQGIQNLTPEIVQNALEQNKRIRLLGSVYPENGNWHTKVRPVILDQQHPMARAASNKNALYFNGDACGDIFITGAGAGGKATASGVLADVINASAGKAGPSPLTTAKPIPDIEVEVLQEV